MQTLYGIFKDHIQSKLPVNLYPFFPCFILVFLFHLCQRNDAHSATLSTLRFLPFSCKLHVGFSLFQQKKIFLSDLQAFFFFIFLSKLLVNPSYR